MPRLLLSFLACLICLTALIAPALVASAQDDTDSGRSTWGIGPASADGPDGRASIQLVTEPGQTYRDHVAVRNLSDDELALALYAADAVNTTDGGFDVQTDDEENTLAGAWITLADHGVTLGPRETAVVPLEVAVPENAEPGDHAAGVVTVLTRTTEEGVSTQNRVGTRVHVRVAGAALPAVDVAVDAAEFDSSWIPFSPGGVEVTYTITNSGNVRLGGMPRITVSGPFGLTSRQLDDEGFADLLPGNTLERTVRIEGVLPLLRASARVDVVEATSGDQPLHDALAVRDEERGLWTVSPSSLAVLLALMAAVVALSLRRRRRGHEPTPSP